MRINQIGRSMVEMLGVLAVIGMLSVGAIAEYSKVMLKYKLNKQATQYNQILYAVYKTDDWGKISNNMVPVLKALNEIPKEMLKSNDGYVYDIFNNKISITYNSYYMAPKLQIYLDLNETNDSMENCRNIFFILKEWHENMFVMESYGTLSGSGSQNLQVYGDQYCTNNRTCLVNLSLSKIDNLCRAQLGREFMIQIYTADRR